MLSPREVVKEVAKLIANDQICYIHRSSRVIASFAQEELETPQGAAQIEHIEKDISKYMKIAPMNKAALLSAMQYFIPEVTDLDVSKELTRGLKRKNPTRNFLQIVESHMDIKQHWRRFLKEHTHWYVEQLMIEAYNY